MTLSDENEKSVDVPPGAWKPARSLAKSAIAPLEKFIEIEASGGILLIIVAALAMFWANSSFRESYFGFWHTPLGVEIGDWSFRKDLHFWINDGLMTIFFFVVGLEIRRELHRGELRQLRKAALPLVAAFGGMVVPAAIFLIFNYGTEGSVGWGIPMATDIAFAVGVIALLGRRIPSSLRILLLTLAVIDDIGAILIIALFYSNELSMYGFQLAGLGILSIFILQKIGMRSPWTYLPFAVVVWSGFYVAGIHPTIAGVVIGLMTPVKAWFGSEWFLKTVSKNVDSIKEKSEVNEDEMLPYLKEVEIARREAVSPVESLQAAFHGWVAYAIMPLFALANAGIPIGSASFEGSSFNVFCGIVCALVIGKPLGIFVFSWLAVRFKLASLPSQVNWIGILIIGLSAGIGFTMSIFVAQLAFRPGAVLETSKLAVLIASSFSALFAFMAGYRLLSNQENSVTRKG